MELGQELTNNFKITDLGKEQGQFMNNMMNSVMNTALDIGLRALIPDLIEQQVIDIKNSLFSEGLQEGINTAINSLKDFAKSALGIVQVILKILHKFKMLLKREELLIPFLILLILHLINVWIKG